jgi:hypothetical protein
VFSVRSVPLLERAPTSTNQLTNRNLAMGLSRIDGDKSRRNWVRSGASGWGSSGDYRSSEGPIWEPASRRGRRRQTKKRTQGDGGSRKKMAAARRQMTRRAVPARCRGRYHKGPTVEKRQRKKRTKDYVVRGALKGRTFEKRRRT